MTEGKIYIQSGEVFDAEIPGTLGEPAFQRILSWKTGSFEILPPDSARVRTIFTSYQGLLLNTAQAIDEAASMEVTSMEPSATPNAISNPGNLAPLLAEVSQIEGVEFVLALSSEKNSAKNFWGLDNPKPVAEFTKQTLANFRELGERLQVGELQQILGNGPQRKVAVGTCGNSDVIVGFPPAMEAEQVSESFRNILTKWAS
jgi:hypothetical protein